MTHFYKIDCFPPTVTPSYKRHWLKAGQAVIRAGERLRSGNVSKADVKPLALLYTGDEEAAGKIYFEWLKARNDRDMG